MNHLCERHTETAPRTPRSRAAAERKRRVAGIVEGLHPVWRIDRAMRIHGELTADSDVFIDGEFEGAISLDEHGLSTGVASRITAGIFAARVLVRGEVRGDITASERVRITRTAKVYGNITAPRVTLDPGCTVDGKITSG